MDKETQIAGFLLFYLDENIVKRMIVPFRSHDSFIEKFGSDFREFGKEEIKEMKEYLATFSTVIN